jgi:hypothetical protein
VYVGFLTTFPIIGILEKPNQRGTHGNVRIGWGRHYGLRNFIICFATFFCVRSLTDTAKKSRIRPGLTLAPVLRIDAAPEPPELARVLSEAPCPTSTMLLSVYIQAVIGSAVFKPSPVCI